MNLCFCIGCCCAQYTAIRVDRVAKAQIRVALFGKGTGLQVFDGSAACEEAAVSLSDTKKR